MMARKYQTKCLGLKDQNPHLCRKERGKGGAPDSSLLRVFLHQLLFHLYSMQLPGFARRTAEGGCPHTINNSYTSP
jgi:hypothetical protein